MASIAPDICDLEKKLNDGEGDHILSQRAIEIYERLRYEMEQAKKKGDKARYRALQDEESDFDHVLEEIEKRRHKHVLDEFDEYLNTHV